MDVFLPTRAGPIRVLIVDEHAISRQTLRARLEAQRDFQVIAEAAGVADAVAQGGLHVSDVVLLDADKPSEVLHGLRRLKVAAPGARVIVLAANLSRSETLEAIRSGARGIIAKDRPTELLYRSIRRVMDGEIWLPRDAVSELVDELRRMAVPTAPAPIQRRLTAREQQILALVAAGSPNKEIAHECALSEDTVKRYLTRIFGKTGTSSRLELAMLVRRAGTDGAA